MRIRALTVAALGAVLTLSACGGTPEHNEADVMFASQMIPHHKQAVSMADMVPAHTGDPKLRSLAEQIKKAQQPEIDKMTGWLDSWGAEDKAKEHSGHAMTGMMSEQDMSKLGTVNGKPFDTMWLNMMIKHHQGAVDMSNTELKDGSAAEAKQLARDIIGAQRKEIDTMRGMLG
ncbi:DUF305 domain-containing protein [Sciscionella sediminilitoris]|uniref:DUF305 domain-containing protein n=1 Tax=Sciscionella sediminilitoris TaxID=1445613 RepID=UPI000568D993|nr:DUF305 domain-containing protein [Sciscionella sp. SE31]